MYLRYPTRVALALAVVLALAGCARRSTQPPPAAPPGVQGVIDTAFEPGVSHSLVSTDPRAAQYYDNANAVIEGKRLFSQYNCSGCHSNGGGGMGPSLMDNEWIYGGRLTQIHQTLVEGRPNGMPAFRGKIPDDQVWQLVAFVRSLSGLVRTDVASGRDDHMRVKLSEQERNDESPTAAGGLPKTSEMPP